MKLAKPEEEEEEEAVILSRSMLQVLGSLRSDQNLTHVDTWEQDTFQAPWRVAAPTANAAVQYVKVTGAFLILNHSLDWHLLLSDCTWH